MSLSTFFTATCSVPGGCNESYVIEGTFTDNDTWTGTFTAAYTGGGCVDCMNPQPSPCSGAITGYRNTSCPCP